MIRKKLLFITSSFPKYKGDINGNFIYELALRIKDEYEVVIVAPLG